MIFGDQIKNQVGIIKFDGAHPVKAEFEVGMKMRIHEAPVNITYVEK